MRIIPHSNLHLTYCLNAFPPPDPADPAPFFRDVLEPLKQATGFAGPVGLGLWLDHGAATRLREPAVGSGFLEKLKQKGFYLFTLNGFPYGAFHGTKIKEKVFQPDWTSPRRLSYTLDLAALLARASPPEGWATISTVPLGYGPALAAPAARRRAAEMLLEAARALDRCHRREGTHIVLALEPEPDAALETCSQAAAFFRRTLLPAARAAGGAAAEDLVRRHVGLCADLAHGAVVGESLDEVVSCCRTAGISLAKVHLSAALLAAPGRCDLQRLSAFADDVYLHQVRGRNTDGTALRWPDLPAALADARFHRCPEVRIHFHVPLAWQGEPGLSPSPLPRPEAFRSAVEAGCRHFEVETYTYEVLPPDLRATPPVVAAGKELQVAAVFLRSVFPRPATT